MYSVPAIIEPHNPLLLSLLFKLTQKMNAPPQAYGNHLIKTSLISILLQTASYYLSR